MRYALLSHYTAYSCNSLPTFRNCLSVPYSRNFLKDGTDRLFRNFGKKLPLYAAYWPRRAHIASASGWKFEITHKSYVLDCCDRASWEKCEERENQQDATITFFIIKFCLNMFRASLCPSSGEQRPCVTACGVLRWFCWMWLVAVVGTQCSHPTTQRPTTATNHIQQNQLSTPYAVTHGLCSPEDGHNDAWNMLRQKLIINIWLLHLVGFLSHFTLYGSICHAEGLGLLLAKGCDPISALTPCKQKHPLDLSAHTIRTAVYAWSGLWPWR